jgi:hypothetical protein
MVIYITQLWENQLYIQYYRTTRRGFIFGEALANCEKATVKYMKTLMTRKIYVNNQCGS